jgi:hypothetical protein
MGPKGHASIESLGNECYVMAASRQAMCVWDEQEQVDTVLPVDGTPTGESVGVLRDGAKLRYV